MHGIILLMLISNVLNIVDARSQWLDKGKNQFELSRQLKMQKACSVKDRHGGLVAKASAS